MQKITWILKFVVFPLLPFFLGATIRCLHHGSIEFGLFSPSELAFSMALLTLVLSISASRIENQELRSGLAQVFQLGAIIYLALFSWAIFLEVDISRNQSESLGSIRQILSQSQQPTIDDLPVSKSLYQSMLDRLRWITVILSVVVVPLALIANFKYDLEKAWIHATYTNLRWCSRWP